MSANAIARANQADLDDLLVYRVARRPRSSLPTAVERLLSHFDGSRSLVEACECAQISVAKGEAAVRKLTQMGIVEPVSTTRITASMSAFSAEEEAFFASEVEPIDLCNEPFESVGEKVNLFVSELMMRVMGSPAI